MINRVVLTGRLVADVELRQTSDGTPYTFFTLAVGRTNNREKTDFINAVAWRNTAEFMSNYFKKGSLIGVEGRIESFVSEVNGQNQTRINVNVSQVHFLEKKSDVEKRENQTNRVSFQNESKILEQESPNREQESAFDVSNKKDNDMSKEEINFDDIKF